MTPMTVRGVPRGLQRDAWWMAPDAQSGVGAETTAPKSYRLIALAGLVALADVMAFRTQLGLGFVILVLALASAAQWYLRATVSRTKTLRAWVVLLIALVPAVDVFQFTSFVIAWSGLMVFAAILSGDRILAATRRLPFYGVRQTWHEVVTTRADRPDRSNLFDWMLPIVVGGIFALLFAVANPIVTNWIGNLDFNDAPSLESFLAWCLAALAFWPLLRIGAMGLHKPPARPLAKVDRMRVVNARSVSRALVVFNVLFVAQTMMDMGFLWGGVRLPDGLTYAEYAHRGAYPLMVTALLAGAFALVAQPWLDGKTMRGLLLVWIAQTVMLVMSSILQLDLYIDVYGLTHLRFAAFVWMIVVALGLVVLILQIIGRKDAGWMLRRAFGIGAFAVYICSLTNVADYVARHQLSKGPLDVWYVCPLNEGAVIDVARLKPDLCDDRYLEPTLMVPSDLREWGFRNARMRHKLEAMKAGIEA